MSPTTQQALRNVGIGTAIGAAIGGVSGVVNNGNVLQSTVIGGAGGAAITTLVGLVGAIVGNTDEWLETAAIGLGATIALRLVE